MDRTTSTTIVIVLILLALLGMVLGWRARQRRQAQLPRLAEVPADSGEPSFEADVFYVATTIAGQPLDRVAVSGLGFRARATVGVTARGVILSIAGEPDGFLPSASLRTVERATWTIDRVVEPGGLVVIGWTLGDTDVDTYLRVAEREDPTPLIDALTGALPNTSTTSTPTPNGSGIA